MNLNNRNLLTIIGLIYCNFCLAIYSPTSQTSKIVVEECDTLMLMNGAQLMIKVDSFDLERLYFKGCDQQDQSQQFIGLHAIKNVNNFIDPPSECDILTISDQVKLEVNFIKIDNKNLYFITCKDKNDFLRVLPKSKVLKYSDSAYKRKIKKKLIYNNYSNDDQCDVIILNNGKELDVFINSIDDTHIFFHICGERDFPERSLKLDNILKYRFYKEMYPFECDLLELKNGSTYEIVVDTIMDGAMFVRLCNSKDVRQKKIAISTVHKHTSSRNRIAKPNKFNTYVKEDNPVMRDIFFNVLAFLLFIPLLSIIFTFIFLPLGIIGFILALLLTGAIFGLLYQSLHKKENRKGKFSKGFAGTIIGYLVTILIWNIFR